MPLNVEAITTAALSAALDTASRRQATIAANIANANVAGYVPMRVGFDAHLAQARQAMEERGTLDAAQVPDLRAEAEPLLDEAGQPARVQVDAEMTELARNSVQFQALIQGLSRHLALLATAAADGRK